MTEKKPENKPEEVKAETVEELDSEQLDEVHGGARISTPGNTISRLGHTLTPVGNTVSHDFDLNAETIYGGADPGIPSPLRR